MKKKPPEPQGFPPGYEICDVPPPPSEEVIEEFVLEYEVEPAKQKQNEARRTELKNHTEKQTEVKIEQTEVEIENVAAMR